jgi:TRAP-type C4-dicarboxylate transport system substrate-binding protein
MNKLTMALLLPLALAAGHGAPAFAQEHNLSFQIVRANLSAFDDQQIAAAFDRVTERTNGDFKVTTIFAGTLPIQSAEWLRAVGSGDLDMAMIVGDYHAGDFPLLGLLQTPFLFRDQVEKNLATAATYSILQREANKLNVQLLTPVPFGELGFWTTEPFEDISSLPGVKLRAQSKLLSDMVTAMGGEPVPVEWAEAYTSLQRGLVKGIFTGWESFTGAKMQEVAPYAHRTHLNNTAAFVGMNKEIWDSISPETQAIILEELGHAALTIQAQVPEIISNQVALQKASGLIDYTDHPGEAWFFLMEEKLAKPILAAEMEKSGDAGEEIVGAIEAAIGRSVR